MTGVERRNEETRRMAARSFLTFLARRASKVIRWKPICVSGTRHFFSLGRRRPKHVPFHIVPFHSAGLRPGKMKLQQRFAVGVSFYLVQLETLSYKEKRCDRMVTPLLYTRANDLFCSGSLCGNFGRCLSSRSSSLLSGGLT